MRSSELLLGSVVAGILLGAGLSIPVAKGGETGPLRTISPSEIKEGMKGYGLTVFKGTEPERFDVEVVGTLKNFRPGQELILIRTLHPRLDITKNVRGMSGSPIYFDGRLAGAYAYSWTSFQVEPIAGVTPIGPMLAEMRRPIPPGFWPLEGAAPLPGAKPRPAPGPTSSFHRFDGPPGTYDLEAHARQLSGRLAPDPTRTLVPTSTPLMLSGVTDRTADWVRRVFGPLGFEPLQSGGGQGVEPGAPEHYVNGGAVAVSMVSGDVAFSGLGTVTHVEGSRLCAFGHPMMGAGDSALPTAVGRVHWIFASAQHSSKIGEAIRPLGAMVQDRQSAIVVDEKQPAPTFPLSVRIDGAEGSPKHDWKMVVAEDKFMTPGFVAAAMGSVVEATVAERRDVTWRMKSRLSVRGHGTLEFEDSGVASGGTPDQDDWARSRIVRALGDVLNNPWELARIDGIESVLNVQYTRDILRVRGADVLETEVDPGEKVHVRLHLVPFAGKEVLRTVEVPLPRELSGRDVEIDFVPGYEVQADAASPDSLNELLANALRVGASPRSLVAQVRLPTPGVAYRGRVASRLPGFALDALRPTTSDVAPEPIASLQRTEIPIDRFIDGRTRVKVKVRASAR